MYACAALHSGTVWRCRDKNTGRIVAVKKMKDPTPVDSEEYAFALREVQLLQMLQHSNVVQLLEVSTMQQSTTCSNPHSHAMHLA